MNEDLILTISRLTIVSREAKKKHSNTTTECVIYTALSAKVMALKQGANTSRLLPKTELSLGNTLQMALQLPFVHFKRGRSVVILWIYSFAFTSHSFTNREVPDVLTDVITTYTAA